MKVVNFALSLSAGLILGSNLLATAGPQSLLDPYANIQAPKGGQQNTATKEKKKKENDSQVKAVHFQAGKAVPQPVAVKKAPAETTAEAPSTPAAAADEAGLLAGTKQIGHGIMTTTKGAFSPMITGTKKVGEVTGSLVKGSGSFMVSGAKATGSGIKSASEKVVDGTGVVGEKMMGAPKAIGHGLKTAGGKVVGGSQVVGEKVKDGTCAAGSKLIEFPKFFGKGVVSCATHVKDGASAAGGAIGSGLGKLNPFKHEKPQVASSTPSFQN